MVSVQSLSFPPRKTQLPLLHPNHLPQWRPHRFRAVAEPCLTRKSGISSSIPERSAGLLETYNKIPWTWRKTAPVDIPSTQKKVPMGISFERKRRLGTLASKYIWFVNEIEGLSLTKAMSSACQTFVNLSDLSAAIRWMEDFTAMNKPMIAYCDPFVTMRISQENPGGGANSNFRIRPYIGRLSRFHAYPRA